MIKLNDFINRLELALKEPSKYQSGGWGKWDGKYWNWDCICLIKGILWGWKNDKTKPRGGGAVYGSNGVPDIGENSMIKQCKNVSSDFTKIQKGEMVWMDGHAGVYVGDGNVIEATAGWNTWKVVKSQIGKNGERTYNGKGGSRSWEKHGFLPYVNYETTKTIDELAQEVLDGKWGNNPQRKENLIKAGYNYYKVQARVNEIVNNNRINLKSNEELAKEVIAGKWGNGKDRKVRLTNAGYNYYKVQDLVNKMYVK